jgi:hypothetical protein
MARKTAVDREKREALDKGLKAMFRNVEQRPVPEALRAVVDQLEAARAPRRRKMRKA